ncbi:MAG: type II toxin-antitoxin system VapC family toxin [Acidobacteriota bacterium]
MSKYVLDASALLALLNNEPGAQRVKDILSESVIGAVNVCETVGKLANAGMDLSDARASIELINLEVVPFDAELAYKAGSLIVETKKLGLSLGDRACLALGLMLNQTVVTAERLWSKLKIDVTVEVIRGSAPALPEP